MSRDPQFTKGWPYAPMPRGAGRLSSEEQARREEALAQAGLFAGLPRRHLRSLVKSTGVSTYPEGATVVEEGTTGSKFYVILDGRAKVVRKGRTVDRLSPGDFFGEISLLDGGPRAASVVAESPLRVLTLRGQDFVRMLSSQPRLALRVVRELGRRLRESEHPLVG